VIDLASQPERLIAFEGGRNFRDLGGYRTNTGRVLRWGQLYRSGALNHLTDADRTRFAGLGIRTICDFRAPAERTRAATGWPAAGLETLGWDYDFASVSMRGVLRGATEISAESMQASMTRLYRTLPALFSTPYKDLCASLVQGRVPLVFHCAAGKDRTGLAAALILTALGVPRETVLEDYVLTNTSIDLEAALFTGTRPTIGVGTEHAYLTDVTREVRAPLLEARPGYLEAAFAQMEADHGSVAGYLSERLALTPRALELMRDHLLEG
jgi:protein-tyrosine phosphatase